jgi:hypothetical protein
MARVRTGKTAQPSRAPSAIRAYTNTGTYEGAAATNPDRPMTDKQRLLARTLAMPGMNPAAAARMAGYNDGGTYAYRMIHDPAFQKLLDGEREAYRETNKMTCKRVIDGFLRAVELAEMKTDSIAMTAAWREIGRLCGYYAPKVVKHEISVQGEALKQRLREMSDDELLRLNRGENTLEGEFEIIEDGNFGGSDDNIKDDLTRVR